MPERTVDVAHEWRIGGIGDQAVTHRVLAVADGHRDLRRAAPVLDLRNRVAVGHSHHIRCRGRDAGPEQPQRPDRNSCGANGAGRNDDLLHMPTYV